MTIRIRGYEIKPEANLREANLDKADLRKALLYRANLSGADLEQANLIGADLLETNLSYANLEGIIIDDGTYHEDGTLRTYVIGKK